MKLRLALGVVVLCAINHAATYGNGFKPIVKTFERTISLDSGYLPAQNSNRGMAGFNTEVLMGLGAAYDAGYSYFQPENSVTRTLYYGGFWLASFPIAASTVVTFHEFGHGSRMYSFGGKPIYVHALGECNNYFSEWGMLAFNGYFVLPMVGCFGAAARPDLDLSIIEKHYDYLKDYVDFEKAKTYVKNQKKLEDLYKKAEKDKKLFDYYKESKKLFKDQQKDYLKKQFSDEEIEALDFFSEDDIGKNNPISPEATAIIVAGGLNNNVYMAQRIEDAIWFNQGQHMQLTTNYFKDKASTFVQVFQGSLFSYLGGENSSETTSDHNRLVKVWDEHLDIHVSRTELQLYSILSYFLSAQTYMNLYQVYQTWTNGETHVYPAEWKGFRLPNVSLYLTTKGPTYNVRTGYRWDNDLFLIAGTEFVLSGKQQVEGTLGIRKVFPDLGNLYVHAEAVFNQKAIGGTVSVGGTFNKLINAEVGVSYHDKDTFYGERHIPFVWKGSTDIEAWAKIGVQY